MNIEVSYKNMYFFPFLFLANFLRYPENEKLMVAKRIYIRRYGWLLATRIYFWILIL